MSNLTSSLLPLTNSPYVNPFHLFPLDADYLLNYSSTGLPIDVHTNAEYASQAVAVAAAFIVSPAAALNIARGFVLSRIASCSDRDPLANGQRWIQKQLFFPETLFSAKKIVGEDKGEPDSLGFGSKSTSYYLRFAVIGWLALMLLPLFLTLILDRPVAPFGKVIATFFSIRVSIWGFQSGLLIGEVSSPLLSMSAGDTSQPVAVDYVLGIIPILLPVLALTYFSLQVLRHITTSPFVAEEVKDLEISTAATTREKRRNKKKKTNKHRRNRRRGRGVEEEQDNEDDEDEDDEEMEEQQEKEQKSKEEEDQDAKIIADRKKRKQKKPNLHMAICKVQFCEAGILFGDAKRKREEEKKRKTEEEKAKKEAASNGGKKKPAPKKTAAVPEGKQQSEDTPNYAQRVPEKSWRASLKNWLNNSKIARFLFIGNYCWQGGDIPVLNISTFAELEAKRKLRIETKKKQLEEDIKSGKRKRKWWEPLPTDSDEDGDGGGSSRFKSSAVVQKNRYLSRGNFFVDEDNDGASPIGDDEGNGGFFDDENNNNNNNSNNFGENEDEQQHQQQQQQQPELSTTRNEDDVDPSEEKHKNEDDVDMEEKEKKEKELKEFFDKKLDYVLPPRPPITPAQLVFNRLGSVLEDFYGPPEPLSIEEANRRNVRLPWREYFATIAPHYFVFTVVITVITCIFSGLGAAAPDKYCIAALLLSIVTSGADLVFLAVCFPFIVPVQNVLGIASDGVVVAAGILALSKLPPQETERLAMVQSLTLLLVPLIGLVRIFFSLVRFCILFFGKIAIVSIYYGKRDRDIRCIQRKLRLDEAKEKEKNRRETEKKQSSAVVKKKGGPYSGIKRLEESMMSDDNNNDDLLLMPLPKMRTSSKFQRRGRKQESQDDVNTNEIQQEEELLLYSSPTTTTSISGSPRESRLSRREQLQQQQVEQDEEEETPLEEQASSSKRKRRERKTDRASSLLSTGGSSRRNINLAEI